MLCEILFCPIVFSLKTLQFYAVPKIPAGQDETDKQFLDSLIGQRDNGLKTAVRQMMRLLVARSTYPSPFRRAVPLNELERAFCVLHGSIISALAEEKFALSGLEGKM